MQRAPIPIFLLLAALAGWAGCKRAKPERHAGRVAAILHERHQTKDQLQPPPFEIRPRIPELEKGEFYPCSDCHEDEVETNPKERKLEEEHDTLTLRHGGGRFWCLECHHADDRDFLTGAKGEKISFNTPQKLCGRCHFPQERDFTFGAHGKRLKRWRGKRLLKPCTECHNPHDPSIKPRKPWRPPKVRTGLHRPQSSSSHRAHAEDHGQ